MPLSRRFLVYLAVANFTGLCYFGSQLAPLFEATELIEFAAFSSIPFDPNWVWVYQSIYLALPLVCLSIADREEITSFALGFAYMVLFCTVFFVFLPVRFPRPLPEPGASVPWMYTLISAYDESRNCLPSLHVGFATYLSLYAVRLSGPRTLWRWSAAAGLFVWLLLVAYSTLALKQHYFIDLPLGAMVAMVSFMAFRTEAK